MAALTGLAKVVSHSGNAATAAMLSCVYIYAKLQPTRGLVASPASPGMDQAQPDVRPASIRSWIVSTPLARRRMRFRMRDGSRVTCRILDSGGLLAVHVDRDYDIVGLDWSKMRTIVDIGAHVGSFTIWAALRSPTARLLAVEPNPETFQFLLRNVHDNQLQDRVLAVNVALAPTAGVAGLEFVEHSLGTRLAPSGKGQVTVQVQNIEGLLTEAGMSQVDVLKMDCEGMEYDVFEAMDRDRLRLIEAIACEYHPEPDHDVSQLDAILKSAGFSIARPDTRLGVLWATR